MSFYDYPPYVPVGVRRAKAEKKIAQLRKKNPRLQPIIINGRSLATTWWGKSWNHNLERYADYHNRIERGRSYVRHCAVLDLQLRAGRVTALVQGSQTRPYDVDIKVDKLSASNWATIRRACEGGFDSLSELLAGKFPQALKDLFFKKDAGLFPSPREIHFDCSCPDWASMCKHVAAALYGIGARFDDDPSLFFTLRQINVDDIIAQTVTETAQSLLSKADRQGGDILTDVDLGDVFGIQLDNADSVLPDLPPVATTSGTATARQAKARQERARVVKVATASSPQGGTMVEALSKAIGNARKGKSVDQLAEKLGWTKTQIRNALTRAMAKEMVERVAPGRYRRHV